MVRFRVWKNIEQQKSAATTTAVTTNKVMNRQLVCVGKREQTRGNHRLVTEVSPLCTPLAYSFNHQQHLSFSKYWLMYELCFCCYRRALFNKHDLLFFFFFRSEYARFAESGLHFTFAIFRPKRFSFTSNGKRRVSKYLSARKSAALVCQWNISDLSRKRCTVRNWAPGYRKSRLATRSCRRSQAKWKHSGKLISFEGLLSAVYWVYKVGLRVLIEFRVYIHWISFVNV